MQKRSRAAFLNTLSFVEYFICIRGINTCLLLFLPFLCRWVKDAAQKHWNYGVVVWLKVTMSESTTWQRRGAMDWLSAHSSANVRRLSKCQIWCKYSTDSNTPKMKTETTKLMRFDRSRHCIIVSGNKKRPKRVLSHSHSRGVKLCHVVMRLLPVAHKQLKLSARFQLAGK